MSSSTPDQSAPGTSGPRRKGLVVAVVVLAALLVLAIGVALGIWLTRSGGATTPVAAASATPTQTQTPTQTPTPSVSTPAEQPAATTVPDDEAGGASDGAGGSGDSSTPTAAPPTDGPDPRHGIFTGMTVEREDASSCDDTLNVPLIARVTASGSALWFGVNTTTPMDQPFQFWNMPSGEQTVTGFVYDCSRESEPFSFTFEDDLGTHYTSTIVLRVCPGLPSPREDCSG